MNENLKRPIVCATDFSRASAQAGDIAAALARRLGSRLILAHGADERGDLPASAWRVVREAARPLLHAEAERLRTFGTEVEEMQPGGVPEDGVARCAERADALLLVLAASGAGALHRWLLGSVSENMVESAWVPTLVLREADRMEDWARGGKPLRVFIGADFSPTSEAAMRWAASLRDIGPCEFTVGYVDRLAEQRAEEARHAPPDLACPAEMHEMLKYDLRAKAESCFPPEAVHVRVLPATGHIETHLLEMAAEASADLIVVGTHQWQGLSRLRHPSVSRRLLHRAKISVACVPTHRAVSALRPCSSSASRILIATDLTTHGSHAIPHAFSLLQLGGTAWLLHVAPPGDEVETKIARLRELIPTEAVQLGFHVNAEVVASHDVAATICEAARRFDADYICIGSTGGKAGSGSVAHAVVAHSHCPVLVVPRAWSAGQGFSEDCPA